ncbi:DUF4396 domain-containing protein [Paraoerskovia marina]|uniref:DUF4396 domain-containing protein n=1 Tax=Paraoerskovia marina TaxID=545619 RepID=UPI000ACD4883|nr:DUF4396 domain-containing protein [Paraoerskovia marina]
MPVFPVALHQIAVVSLTVAGLCALVMVVDQVRRPQPMWIMNLVWPLTALFGSVLWLAGYLRWGRGPRRGSDDGPGDAGMPVAVAKGTSHCGAGCALGDLVAEWLAFGFPVIAVWLGYGTLFAEEMFAVWILDLVLAFGFGVVFQYFTIAPMRGLGVRDGLREAVKADAASILAWQVGMYAVMALFQLAWFRPAYDGTAPVDSPEFWFAMQLAMIAGFCTSYPVNWWLIRRGVKEKM